MPRPSPLRRVRESAGLSVIETAELVDVSEAMLEELESRGRYVEPELLDRYANAFGMTKRALLAGQDAGAVAVLFRSMRAHEALEPLLSSGVQEALGGFVRAVRERAEVRRLLGEQTEPRRLAWLEQISPAGLRAPEELHAQARQLAAQFRAYLGIDPVEPIASMLAVAQAVGVTVMFVEADDEPDGPAVDGAALLDPDPAILVNLPAGGGAAWWRTRMIVAHELCHLLHDRGSLAQSGREFFIFSPHRPGHARRSGSQWQLVDRFQDMEMRANAFAGELLAPSPGVRSLVGDDDPTALAVIQRISDHFMIGMTTAVNRLRDTFQLSSEQRKAMERRVRRAQIFAGPTSAAPQSHPDANLRGSTLRDAEFEGLVLRALAAGRLDPIAARDYLGLRLSDPLPESPSLPPQVREPLLTSEHRARHAGERFLRRDAGDPRLCLGALEGTTDGWRAAILERTDRGTFRERGAVLISNTFAVKRLSA